MLILTSALACVAAPSKTAPDNKMAENRLFFCIVFICKLLCKGNVVKLRRSAGNHLTEPLLSSLFFPGS